MKLSEVKELLNAEEVCGAGPMEYADSDVESCHASDLISDLLMFTGPKPILLTGLTNTQVMRTAEILDYVAICFVRGKRPDADTVQSAEEQGVPLFVTPLTMYESCGRLYARGLPATALREAIESCRPMK